MKKILTGIFSLVLFGVLATTAWAVNPEWQLDPGATVYTFTNTCVSGPCGSPGDSYAHTMDVTSFNTTSGDFTATGSYTGDPSITWNMTGNISENLINFTLTYTGSCAGFTETGSGTIGSNGSLSGSASGIGACIVTPMALTWTIQPNATPLLSSNVPSECSGMTFDNVIQGTNSSDTLNGTSGRDLIFGYGGNDTINGGSSDDCLVGGSGRDRINADSGNDVILGGGGNDFDLVGSSGDDRIYGGDGNDPIDAGTGNDTVYGGNGNDTMAGGSGNDTLDGQAGTDSANGNSGTNTCSAETQTNCQPTP